MPEKKRTYKFKTEISKLLEIITHSIYTNKEIFLRELLSNASDALEKMRFELKRDAERSDRDMELTISVTTDKEKKTLTVTDTGIGMTGEETAENIGTIARSGSADFLARALEAKEDASSIIGRFGVGFYSVFMVADRVVLRTTSFHPDAKTVEWESTGSGSYTLRELDERGPRGTSVELHLKEDAASYASPDRVKEIINRHSRFTAFPILVDGERVNTTPALWREPKFSITEERYAEFYRYLTMDEEDPLLSLHVAVDAPVQFTGLIFIPPRGLDLHTLSQTKFGLDLYVRRVLIQKQLSDLLPDYLSFCKGVVDTEDLPLNISRETLQENLLVRRMHSTITKQVLKRLESLADTDQEKYDEFWKVHGQIFKLGYMDFANQEAYSKLLRFDSSAAEEKPTSLADYVSRMKPGQKEIIYITGPSRQSVLRNPHGEIFRKHGVEMLYLFEPIDEFVMQSLGLFKETPIRPAEQADTAFLKEIAPEEKTEKTARTAEEEASFDALLKKMAGLLEGKVEDVRASTRLHDSPACLVSPEGVSSQMERMIRALSKDETPPRRVMEINPDHPLVRNLVDLYASDPADPFIAQATEQLYDLSLLTDGIVGDPHDMVRRATTLLEHASGWYKTSRKS